MPPLFNYTASNDHWMSKKGEIKS